MAHPCAVDAEGGPCHRSGTRVLACFAFSSKIFIGQCFEIVPCEALLIVPAAAGRHGKLAPTLRLSRHAEIEVRAGKL